MLNRLKWIAVSYATSPVILVLAAISAVFWLAILADSMGGGPVPLRAQAAWLGMIWFAFGLGGQLSLEFRTTACRLAPLFAREHALVAGGFGAALIGLTSWQLTLAGIPWITAAALAAAGAPLAIPAAAGLSLMSLKEEKHPFHAFLLLLPTCIMGLLLFVALQVRDREAFGAFPWLLTMGLIGASLCFFALAAWVLRGLSDWTSQTETSGQRLSLWPRRPANWRAAWPTKSTPCDGQIERWLATHTEWTGWRRVERWRLASMPLSWGSAGLTVSVIVVFAVSIGPKASPLVTLRGIAIWAMASLLGTAGVLLILRWRARARMLPWEAMLPGKDSVFRRELAAASASDVAPLALIFATGEALAWNIKEGNRIDWSAVPVSFVTLLPFGFLMLLSCIAVTVVVRRAWLAIAVVIAPLILDHVLFLWLLRTGNLNGKSYLWILIVTAAVVIIVTQRRWRTMELADLG